MTFEIQRLAIARDENDKLLKIVAGACWGSQVSFAQYVEFLLAACKRVDLDITGADFSRMFDSKQGIKYVFRKREDSEDETTRQNQLSVLLYRLMMEDFAQFFTLAAPYIGSELTERKIHGDLTLIDLAKKHNKIRVLEVLEKIGS